DIIRFLAGPADLRIESGSSDATTGHGRNVEIRATSRFELDGGAFPFTFTRVAASTQGNGDGGDIIIEAPSVLIDQAAIFSRTRCGTGAQGGIIIRAQDVQLRNHAEIHSTTDGDRKGSFVLIDTQMLNVGDSSVIAANTAGNGDAGRITVNAQRMKLSGA